MAKTVIGVFRSEADADNAVSDLRFQGFSNEEIGIVAKRGIVTRVGGEGGRGGTEGRGGFGGQRATMSVAGEDVSQGVAAGGVIGGLAGLLAGVGAMAVPGVGPVLAAGPLAGIISGAVTGGIAGGLVDFGIPEERGGFYEEEVRKGNILALVKTDDAKAEKAAQILRRNGASDVESHKVPS